MWVLVCVLVASLLLGMWGPASYLDYSTEQRYVTVILTRLTRLVVFCRARALLPIGVLHRPQ